LAKCLDMQDFLASVWVLVRSFSDAWCFGE
jgi:hypothetical protein